MGEYLPACRARLPSPSSAPSPVARPILRSPLQGDDHQNNGRRRRCQRRLDGAPPAAVHLVRTASRALLPLPVAPRVERRAHHVVPALLTDRFAVGDRDGDPALVRVQHGAPTGVRGAPHPRSRGAVRELVRRVFASLPDRRRSTVSFLLAADRKGSVDDAARHADGGSRRGQCARHRQIRILLQGKHVPDR